MSTYKPASERTMYFIGVTTGKSSIMKVFPAWAKHLGLNAVMRGIDLPPNDNPTHYREVVEFIKSDPFSLGALVTTHKLNLLKASGHLFDDLDPYAKTLHEISSISKCQDKLVGHAKDPISAGASFEAIIPARHWASAGGHLCILGSGGSSLALTLYLHNKSKRGEDVPPKIIVTARRDASLEEMRKVHMEIGFSIPITYMLAPSPTKADKIVGELPPHSMVINATGLGKDGPGSPLSDAVEFPQNALIWEFNYRGDLIFLDQAKAQADAQSLTIVDGWVYFIHGWTRVIAEVFDIDIPMSGLAFDELGQIAKKATS